ncbi:hypothetical protein PF008_g18066 [Phytophthora fragariae]|uniref:Uncharacterized protein n=1 Tax=Phytophthora fragariae TaxID=53985 RepID=A0A6G0R6K6_9STRA|nr:hypothetical protein PF008_g18066 [Phytophthora fragariae]
MTLSEKAAALAACSAAIAAAGAAVVGVEKKTKANKLTATQLDFKASYKMLRVTRGSAQTYAAVRSLSSVWWTS